MDLETLECSDENNKRKRFTLLNKEQDEPIRRSENMLDHNSNGEPILKVEYFEDQEHFPRRKNARGRPKKQIETLEWSDEATEALIDLWQTKGELFNKQHPHFYVREMKDKAVECIKDNLCNKGYDVTSSQILSKFQSLRTYFCSQRTKMTASKKNGYDETECKWRFFKSLQFLDDNMKPRETNANKRHYDRDSQVTSPNSLYFRSMAVNEDMRPSNDYQDPAIGYCEQNKDERHVKCEIENHETKFSLDFKNEDQLFGELIGNMIRQLPPGQNKDVLKLEIQQMIIKAKYNDGKLTG